MTTFRNFVLKNYGVEVPQGNIPGTWFNENGLPMVVACTCCGSTMVSVSAWIDEDGYTYCSGCAGAEDD